MPRKSRRRSRRGGTQCSYSATMKKSEAGSSTDCPRAMPLHDVSIKGPDTHDPTYKAGETLWNSCKNGKGRAIKEFDKEGLKYSSLGCTGGFELPLPEFTSGPVSTDKIVAKRDFLWKDDDTGRQKAYALKYYVKFQPKHAILADIMSKKGGVYAITLIDNDQLGLSISGEPEQWKELAWELYAKRFKQKCLDAHAQLLRECKGDGGACIGATNKYSDEFDALQKKMEKFSKGSFGAKDEYTAVQRQAAEKGTFTGTDGKEHDLSELHKHSGVMDSKTKRELEALYVIGRGGRRRGPRGAELASGAIFFCKSGGTGAGAWNVSQ